jgi:hypothetical protein
MLTATGRMPAVAYCHDATTQGIVRIVARQLPTAVQRGGRMLGESIYGRVWQRARVSALADAQAASPLPLGHMTCAAAASPSASMRAFPRPR